MKNLSQPGGDGLQNAFSLGIGNCEGIAREQLENGDRRARSERVTNLITGCNFSKTELLGKVISID